MTGMLPGGSDEKFHAAWKFIDAFGLARAVAFHQSFTSQKIQLERCSTFAHRGAECRQDVQISHYVKTSLYARCCMQLVQIAS